MTEEEAFVFLGIASHDEAEDAFEEQLFELKQYFLTKPMVSKLFKTQLTKIDRLFEVARALKIEQSVNKDHLDFDQVPFEGRILEDYLLFEKNRAVFKQKILNYFDPLQIRNIVEGILNVQRNYLSLWPDIEEDEVLIGKEPDPMELLAAIRSLNERGVFQFSELNQFKSEIPVTFLNEWKRLSLLSKKEEEWRMSSQS